MAYLTTTLDSNRFFHLNSGQSTYVGYLPQNYNEATSYRLMVWMHGCGGYAEGDLWSVMSENWITISLGGRDGSCWVPNSDVPKVLAAVADVQKYFNIDKNKIFLSGYSSGGDLTYRAGFENSTLFAGLLVENSDPFRDTQSTSTALIAASTRKINIAHLAHTSDETYPITTVRNSITLLKNSGFPVTLIEKPGTHWDDDVGQTGTNYDLVTYLLPYMDAGWSLGQTTPTPVVQPVPGMTSTVTKYSAPGDQGFTSSKVISDGYSVAAGTYKLTVATKTTNSDDSTVTVSFILYSDTVNYDIEWKSISLDLRGATIDSFWDCVVTGKTGVVTITPTASTKKILAKNKNGFGLTFVRSTDPTKANYQVLVKNIVW